VAETEAAALRAQREAAERAAAEHDEKLAKDDEKRAKKLAKARVVVTRRRGRRYSCRCAVPVSERGRIAARGLEETVLWLLRSRSQCGCRRRSVLSRARDLGARKT
jgi:hypothetical protein